MKLKYNGVWRVISTETHEYPKLMVCDGYQSGSINVRGTRLPLWAIISTTITEGWDTVEKGWSPEKNYGYSKEDLAYFLYCLLEQRGEFGRLLLLLANVERLEYRGDGVWWNIESTRKRVKRQLERCLDVLRQLDVAEEK